ncbi:MAG: helix-turn-helix domain-containing protein [Clostridiales bacterium]|nr:helix-turn-helix domain-containing protein [Clostridiales bacterium]
MNRIINEVSVNITPVQYLKNYRIEKACFMLLNTKETIINISYACGSGSSSYFGMKI